jgi:hypothetical protein
VFDNPAPGVLSSDAYERAVGLAASLGWHFTNEDADVNFVAQGYKGDPDIYQFLSFLALVEPKTEESVIEKLPVSGHYNIVLTTRRRGTIPSGLWNTSYMIFLADAAPATQDERARIPEKLARIR